jgi:glutaconyl-CoA/methylmalonyl-CoA decarboxylase subunit delta
MDTLNTAMDTLNLASDKLLNEIQFNPQRILEHDGLMVTVVGYTVVFVALLFLYMIFKNLVKLLNLKTNKELKKIGEDVKGTKQEELAISGEINSAIALSLYLYQTQSMDNENPVLTIKKVQRSYSPWSSKIYGLRDNPSLK